MFFKKVSKNAWSGWEGALYNGKNISWAQKTPNVMKCPEMKKTKFDHMPQPAPAYT